MKLDIEKFTGKNDFGLWKIKMKALMTHNGLADALKVTAGETSSRDGEKMDEIQEKAHCVIILCLGDRVLREVSRGLMRIICLNNLMISTGQWMI
ncbi:hypothetical protein ACS0TY_017350 [Phlomoides rotata]